MKASGRWTISLEVIFWADSKHVVAGGSGQVREQSEGKESLRYRFPQPAE
jgi:hypothetical protein